MMTALELISELEKRAGYDEVSRAALGFIQKTIGICNSLPNGQEIIQSIEHSDYFVDYNDTLRLHIDKDENWKLGRIK